MLVRGNPFNTNYNHFIYYLLAFYTSTAAVSSKNRFVHLSKPQCLLTLPMPLVFLNPWWGDEKITGIKQKSAEIIYSKCSVQEWIKKIWP